MKVGITYDKAGELKLTPQGMTPSLGHTKLDAMLSRVVSEIRGQGGELQVPQRDGKTQGVSRSVKAWSGYASLHPFLDLWTRQSKLQKLLGFFASLTEPVLHGEYGVLMRTGRTSCSRPRSPDLPGLNIQQMPKLPEFRVLFEPALGRRLFIGDYAAAELRTLAAVCRAKFGASRLGDVIAGGIDPHAFTAASLLSLKPDEFQKLKETDAERYKKGRQQAKPINFGVPGGMGAPALQAYAATTYKVTLSEEEAVRFRARLIGEVYPELSDRDGYLADTGLAALARNLGVTERAVWEMFDRSGQRNTWAARGVAKVVRGTSTASEAYQARVWDGLYRLLQTVQNPDPEIAEMIAGEQGGQTLDGRLYRQSAATLTGLLRAGVSYTDSKNTPFQSLCADGGKLALWKLLYAGYEPYAFIHDEILVELPAAEAEDQAKKVAAIMAAAMEEVMGQGVPAACDWTVADCWVKP